jgi:response regulator RpfG family c-di-GMP phosphodiesterase
MMETVKMFSVLLEIYDENLAAYSLRAATLARDLATRLGLTHEQIEDIEIAARLHDIGLLCLPREVCRINEQAFSKLGEQGKALFRRHPEYGQQIVASHARLAGVGQIIRAHHERYDGQGYPDRLEGAAIPIGARILAMISEYERFAMRNGQKDSQGNLQQQQRQEAIKHLREERNKGLDPHLTLAFLELLGEQIEEDDSLIEVTLANLRAGMTLVNGIFGQNGLCIIGPGVTLQAFHLARLESFNRIDPITQKILVCSEAKMELAAPSNS